MAEPQRGEGPPRGPGVVGTSQTARLDHETCASKRRRSRSTGDSINSSLLPTYRPTYLPIYLPTDLPLRLRLRVPLPLRLPLPITGGFWAREREESISCLARTRAPPRLEQEHPGDRTRPGRRSEKAVMYYKAPLNTAPSTPPTNNNHTDHRP